MTATDLPLETISTPLDSAKVTRATTSSRLAPRGSVMRRVTAAPTGRSPDTRTRTPEVLISRTWPSRTPRSKVSSVTGQLALARAAPRRSRPFTLASSCPNQLASRARPVSSPPSLPAQRAPRRLR